MDILLRIITLITLALLGGLLYPAVANLLIILNLVPADADTTNFGYSMTNKAVFVWMGAVILGIIALFIRPKKWRYALMALPLFAPSIFAFIYALSAQ